MPENNQTSTYTDFARQFQPGTLINERYRIVRLVGAGGMGRVYQAHDEQLDIDVALKLIRPELLADEKSVERFKNEVILARKVSHKNVSRIHDFAEVDGLKYLTMTYIEGKSLREIILGSGSLSVQRSIGLAGQIAEGMAAAHEEGVVHRDLKPGNIMVDEQGRAFITDFGIARTLQTSDLTQPGVVIGTPAYLSPEQTWGEIADQQSDIYAFGLICCEMLAGRLPFDSGTAHSFKTRGPQDLDDLLLKIQPDTPRYFIRVIKKCLAPSKQARYQSARSIVEDLAARQAPSSGARFSPKSLVALGLVVLAAIAAFVFRDSLFQRDRPASSLSQAVELQSIAVLPFVNKTGDENLNWVEQGMTDLLITDLSQQPGLRVVSGERVFETLDDLKIPPDSISDDDVERLAEILNADTVVRGTFIRAGKAFRADAALIHSDRPQDVRYLKVAGSRLEDLFQISHQLAEQIQKTLPSGSDAVKSTVETNSVEALRAFHQGSESMRHGDFRKSAESFRASIRYDPNFLRAYMRLAEALERDGTEAQAIETLQTALKRPNTNQKAHNLIRAKSALLQGEMEQAIGLYRELGRQYPNDSQVLFNLAIAAEDAGDLKQAIDALESVVRLDPNHPEAYFYLGKTTILMGDADKAISQHLLKALGISSKLNNKWSEADVLNAIGVGYERLGRYKHAVKYFGDSAAIKEEIGNKKGLAVSLSNIARIYLFQGEYAKTEEILKRTITVFEELNDQKGIADITNMYGAIHEDQGQYTKALEYYREALQIRKDIKNDRLTAQSYDNIGHIYYLQGKLDDAQVYWEQGLNLRKTIGEEGGIILSLQNLGFLQMAQGHLDDATKLFVQALDQGRKIEFENAVAVSLGNLGTIYRRQGRYKAALDSYGEAVQILEKLKDQKGIAEYTMLSGSAYLDLHALQRAEEKLDAALKTSEAIGGVETIVDTKIFLAQLHRFKGDLNRSGKLLQEATQAANRDRYQRAIPQLQIEQAMWLMESGKSMEASKLLENASKKLEESGDMWARLNVQYARAKFYLEQAQPARTAEVCREAILLAERAGAAPDLYRFHSLAGHAYLALKSRGKAAEHFQKGELSVAAIKNALPDDLVAGFLQIPEVVEMKKGL